MLNLEEFVNVLCRYLGIEWQPLALKPIPVDTRPAREHR